MDGSMMAALDMAAVPTGYYPSSQTYVGDGGSDLSQIPL